MDAAPSGHPTRKELSSFGLGKLDEPSAEFVSKHLEQCPDCRKQVAVMSADSSLGRIRDAQGPAMSTYGQSPRSGSAFGEASPMAAAPPPSHTLPPGLADHPDYEIKRELGRGGMGVVYLAHNNLLGRDEVLKVMGRHIIDRPEALDRFMREIRSVARLRHPNIVTGFHASRIGDDIVLSMEYVEGLDLARLVKAKGPLPVAQACNFAYQAALALQHAHEEGLVHRDIKPGNLMLSSLGTKATIKILDFGLAKATRGQSFESALTSDGQTMGTPDFIAPEQIFDAQSADIRADIYSLGATLYYLLTARPPFRANSLYEIYQAHISRDADALNLVRPVVPAELAALVAKMMAKSPASRFQTPNEVAHTLLPFFKKRAVIFEEPALDVSEPRSPAAASSPGESLASHRQPSAGATVSVSAIPPAAPKASEPQWQSLTVPGNAHISITATAVPGQATRWSSLSPWSLGTVTASLCGLTVALALGVFMVNRQDPSTTREKLPVVAGVNSSVLAPSSVSPRSTEIAESRQLRGEIPASQADARERSREDPPADSTLVAAKPKATAKEELRHREELDGARSVNSDVATRLTFVNQSNHSVRLYWLNFEGQRVLYTTIDAGQTLLQGTFVTHPWVITDDRDRAWDVYYPTAEPRTVIIEEPKQSD